MDFQTLNLLFQFGKEFGHRKIRTHGLSDTECLLCSYVCAHPLCTQDDAVQALRLDKSTAAKALQTLERKELVVRRQDETDRRKKLLRVTQAGTEKLSSIMNLHDRWFHQVLTALSPEEQVQFEAYCLRLLRAAETIEACNTPDENEGGTPPTSSH